MAFGYTILVISVIGAGFLQLIRQIREDSIEFSEKSDNMS